MQLQPITLQDAKAHVRKHHRTHKKVAGGLFALSAWKDGQLVGVIIVGRPCRGLQDGWTCEVVRCSTNGTRNACSFLYQKAHRVAQAMGYARMFTLTMPEEGGASLRAVGWKLTGKTKGQSWELPVTATRGQAPARAKVSMAGCIANPSPGLPAGEGRRGMWAR